MGNTVDTVNQDDGAGGEEIAELIHALRHQFNNQRYRGQRAGEHDLSHMEARVLYYLGRNPGATQRDTVAHFGRDKAQLARLIAVLREGGLVEARADETDRRLQRLYLTPGGLAVHAAVKERRRRLADQAVAGLSRAERTALVALLGRIGANLSEA